MLYCIVSYSLSPSANPLSHKDYHPLQGVEYPSCSIFLQDHSFLASWHHYCNVYLSSGIAKSRGLFHAKIGRQRLQQMLPAFDLDANVNGSYTGWG